MKNKKYILYISIFTLIYILLIILFYSNNLYIIDDFIYNKIYFNDTLTNIFKIITYLGDWIFLVPLSIILIILLKNKMKAIYIGLNLLTSFLINGTFKLILKRNRPIDINLITESGYSFPSGHSMVSASFYGLLIYLIYKSNYSKKTKIILITILIFLILTIGFSRVYLGVHYITDVMAGYSLSIIYLMVYIKIIKLSKKEV